MADIEDHEVTSGTHKDLSKKKRKRKPKNKYKELNMQQKKCSNDEQSDQVLNLPTQSVTHKDLVESDVVKYDESSKNKKQPPKSLTNKKRKRSEHLNSSSGNPLPSKKRKMQDGDGASEAKTEAVPTKNVGSNQKDSKIKKIFSKNKLKEILSRKPKDERRSDGKASKFSPDDDDAPKPKGSLRERMLEKLSVARFRFLNESLYNMSGKEAVEMFEGDKDSFKVYHDGFSSQVAKWPTNPVDLMIKYINKRKEKLTIADLGCGEAKIAQMVKDKVVHSFDLVALNKFVTVCDIRKLPLKSKSVDIAVFCLSLMGTNLVEYICEANRILKKNGILLVAEVLSRFGKVETFVDKVNQLGFSLIKSDSSNKMFIWFEFKRVSDTPNGQMLPKIELEACVYKKR